MGETRHAAAHAKVNLVLEVGPRRADGYHEIDTIIQELELADRVTVSFGEFEGVRASGPFAAGTPEDESNLAWRAAAELAERCARSLAGLGIALDKQIPAAGGLGGGASDAAATLRILQSLWAAPADAVGQAANAAGSDEAFFLVGGTARARGRGERVQPLRALPVHGVALFIPHTTIDRKTARLFAALDALPRAPGDGAQRWAANPPDAVTPGDIVNDFERVAGSQFAGLEELWRGLEARTGERLRLAGAGPTLFWIGDPERTPEIARLADGAACRVIETRTRIRGTA